MQNTLDINLLVTRLCKRIKAAHIDNDKAMSFIERPVYNEDRVEANIKVLKDNRELLYYKVKGDGGFLRGLTVVGSVSDVQKLKNNLPEDFYFGIPLKESSIAKEFESATLTINFGEY